MRIEKLSFCNINSLKGAWSIDFTDPNLKCDGLFLITGPTGSGKSTILDAICMALYGKTPRLSNLTSGFNEALTKGQRECFAEVVFSADGKKYSSKWSQRLKKGRKNNPDTLDAPKREIALQPSGKILSEKSTECSKLIQELTGMSYEQFTKSVLLAQGDFAHFLNAKDADRAEILEQITGTSIYSDISRKIFERRGEEKKALELLKVELEAGEILSPEERQEIQNELRDGKVREEELKTALERSRSLLKDLENLLKAKEEQQELLGEQDKLFADEAQFKSEALKLAEQEKLQPMNAEYGVLLKLRQDLNTAKATLKARTDTELPQIKSSRDQALKEEKDLSERLSMAEEHEKEALGLVVTARTYTGEKNSLEKICVEKQDLAKKLKAEAQEMKKNVAATEKSIALTEDKLQSLQEIAGNDIEKKLTAELSALTNAVEAIKSADKELLKRDKANKDASAAYKTALKESRRRIDDLCKIESSYEEARKECDTALQAYKSVQENGNEDKLSELIKLKEKVLSCIKQTQALTDATLESEKDLKLREKACEKLKDQLEGLNVDLKGRRECAQALERAVQSARTALEQWKSIERFKDLRSSLKDGEPCPCCGSLHHPYISDQKFDDGEGERLASNLALNEKAYQDQKNELLVLEKQYSKLDGKLSSAHENLNAARAQNIKAKDALRCDLKDLSISLHDLLLKDENVTVSDLFRDQEITGEDLLPLNTVVINTAAQISSSLEKDQGILKELNDAKALLNTKEKALNLKKDKLSDLRIAAVASSEIEKSALTQLENCKAEFLNATQEHAKQINSLNNKLLSYNVAYDPELGGDELIKKLSARADAFEQAFADKNEAEMKLSSLHTAFKQQTENFKDRSEKLNALQDSLKSYEKQIADFKSEIVKLIGNCTPDEFEKTIRDQVAELRRKKEQALNRRANAEKDLMRVQSAIEELSKSVNDQEKELSSALEHFLLHIGSIGIQTEEDYKQHLLDDASLNRLKVQQQSLDNRRIAINSRLKRAELDISTLKELVPAALDRDELSLKIREHEEGYRSVLSNNGSLTQRLNDDDERIAKKQEIISAYEKQKEVFDRWDALNVLIGSSDGKKFKTYAQTLTLRSLIIEANRELKLFNDRYVLTHSDDPERPLEFNVIDNWHNGQRRSVSNLSGGESFIVSLSLALGLSHMAHGKSSIETLFLDEGFGTLDPKALDQALNALVQLNSTHKGLIGIISHVEQLKDRINSRITMLRRGDGFSELVGPGCAEIVKK